jgi:hypothetical protein
MTDAATPETATASPIHDLNSAARAIEKIIRRDEEADPIETEPTSEEAASESDVPDLEDDGDDIDSEDEGTGAVDDDDGDGEEERDGSDEPRYRVKVGGEETEVTLNELIKGYQRGADYTKKTMRLADARRDLARAQAELESERAAVVVERRHHADRLGRQIPALQQQLAQFDGIDWNRLSSENPTLFAQAKPVYDVLSTQLQQAEAEQLQLRQQEQQRQLQVVQAHQDHVAQQKHALIAKLPEMADPVKGRQESAALTRYLLESGYRQEELSRLIDHRDFILARKAMLYDRLMANRDKVRETLAALPRVQKPGTARGPRAGAAERRARLMTRLERSGRTEDAARLIEEML